MSPAFYQALEVYINCESPKIFPKLMQIPGELHIFSKPSLIPCLVSTYADSTLYNVCLKVMAYLISTKLTKPFTLWDRSDYMSTGKGDTCNNRREMFILRSPKQLSTCVLFIPPLQKKYTATPQYLLFIFLSLLHFAPTDCLGWNKPNFPSGPRQINLPIFLCSPTSCSHDCCCGPPSNPSSCKSFPKESSFAKRNWVPLLT